ncbi:glycerophosphodiester phosphodiesterase family protein [Dermacoccus barathri]|uniref:glycerophosphodiester phosphodiesterase family protein n=1 Tax=Dermacoccus barathri TaxID=322601 RepID=UPI00187916BA|nr:glycerophosphodiester phosphodiesterase family protein [Dermacoccus barathri]MBE7371797.1 glycerophosphodiester phosphodiesterase [Dermacoccus barathri]
MALHALPEALAHRGFSGGDDHTLENSMSAFDAAVRLGYRWVETDVHATADGVLLAFHDETLDRTTDARGVIAQLPWSVVSEARINGVEPIPRLDDLFTRHPQLCVNIDVKAAGAIEPLIACIEQHGAHDRVRVASFSEKRRRAVLSGLSRPVRSSPGQELMTALWVSAHVPVVGRMLFRRLAKGIDALQIPERHGRVRVLDRALLNAALAAGVEVHVWTVNERSDMERLLDFGVDGLVTDRADTLKDVLVARGEWTVEGDDLPA